ncbi:MAG TPA: hypothetical protein VGQ08_09055 [Nitrospiraceae bacterium]|nr:hypothetical protein [Nitrospiraceae bacterium]
MDLLNNEAIPRIQIHGSCIEWDGVFKPPGEDPFPNFLGNVNKPNNGFWTFSERPDTGSTWLDVCASQSIKSSPVEIHRFEVVGSPRILVLRRQQEILDLAFKWRLLSDHLLTAEFGNEEWREYADDAYASETADEYIERSLEILLYDNRFWVKAGEYYDAVHAPADAAFHETWIASFEVESTFWYRPCLFLKHLGIKIL